MTSVLERLGRLEAVVAAPPPPGGPAQRTAADYGAKTKKGRKVASQAGVKRYGLPIGTPLGKGKAKDQQDAYNRFRDQKTPADLTRSASYMSNGDLALTAKGVFSTGGTNEWDKAAQVAVVKELAQRGIDPHSLGYKGGYVAVNPNPKKDPTVKAADTVKKAAAKTAKASHADQTGLDAEKMSESDTGVLIKAGWKGDPSDASETLYAPRNAGPLPYNDLSDEARKMLIKAGWRQGTDDNPPALHPPKSVVQSELDRVAKAKAAAQKKAAAQAQTPARRRTATPK